MRPTQKQLDFIEDIREKLELDDPNCQTIEEASKWIAEHIDEYNNVTSGMTEDFGLSMFDTFQESKDE